MSDLERDFWRTRNGRRPGVVASQLEPGDLITLVTDGERPATVILALDSAAVADPGLAVSVVFPDGVSPQGIEVSVEDGADARRFVELGPFGKCLIEGLRPGPVRVAVGGHVALERSSDPLVRDLLARPVTGSLEAEFAALVRSLGAVDAAMRAILGEYMAADSVVGAGSIDGVLDLAVARGPSDVVARALGVNVDPALAAALDGTRVEIRRDATTCTVRLVDLPDGLPDGVRVFVAVGGAGGVSSLGEMSVVGELPEATVRWPHESPPETVTFAVLRA